MGTTVFVGTCNALQWKVAFMLHQWTWIQIFLFILSVFGMLAYFSVLAVELYEYEYVAHTLYGTGLFWLMGFFAVPFFVIFIDVISYEIYFFLAPTREMLYREIENQVRPNKEASFGLEGPIP
jgi:hypothetical protein